MTHPTLKTLIVAGGATFALLAAPIAVNALGGADLGLISSAQAAEHTGGSGGMKGSGGQGGAKKGAPTTKGAPGKGGESSKKIFRVPVGGEEEEDSDRPAWAGVKGGKAGGGGKPAGAGTKKGDLFGDMVVLLRDDNGEPILNEDGLVQVIAYVYDASGKLVPLLDDGEPVIIAYNEEGDLVTTMSVDGVTYEVFGAEVDLGRLSVGRSPEKVLNHALDEALAKLTAEGAVVTLDATGRLVVDGVTIDSPLENLALYDAYMSGDLEVTLPEGFNPASLFAAAADKTGTITVDAVVYMNSILGINDLSTNPDTYYNFDTYNYDRAATWKDVSVDVLVRQDDGSYVVESVNVYDTLFDSDDDGEGDNWTDPTATGGADDFATAADDYLQVIEFVHDNAVR